MPEIVVQNSQKTIYLRPVKWLKDYWLNGDWSKWEDCRIDNEVFIVTH